MSPTFCGCTKPPSFSSAIKRWQIRWKMSLICIRMPRNLIWRSSRCEISSMDWTDCTSGTGSLVEHSSVAIQWLVKSRCCELFHDEIEWFAFITTESPRSMAKVREEWNGEQITNDNSEKRDRMTRGRRERVKFSVWHETLTRNYVQMTFSDIAIHLDTVQRSILGTRL